MKTAVVLFNRDLRLHDHPALRAASRAERTVPLFVLDEGLLGSRFAAPNRVAFMREALADLDEGLRRIGARLFLRRGETVREAIALARECGASELHVSADWSALARAREERLARACARERIAFHAHPGVTVIPPGALRPAGGDHLQGLHAVPPRLGRGAPARGQRRAAPARGSEPARGRAVAGARAADASTGLITAARRAARPRGGG